MYNITHHT